MTAKARPELERHHPQALNGPPFDRQRHLAKGYPGYPTYGGGKSADPRIFLVLDRIEIAELQPERVRAKLKGALILQPKIYRGIEKLFDGFDQLGFRERRALVFEIASAAWRVADYLGRAPEVRRGRPRSLDAAKRT